MTIPGLTLLILRTLVGWTQSRLGAETGLSTSTVSDYEQGTPSMETLQRLAAAMGYCVASVERLLQLVGKILEGRPSDLKHQTAAEVRRQIERVTLVLLDHIEEEGRRRHTEKVSEALRERTPAERRCLLEAFPELGAPEMPGLLGEEAAAARMALSRGERRSRRPALPPGCLALFILRTVAGLTQEALAGAAGIAPETISELERGRVPPPAMLQRLATVMGFPPAEAQRVLLIAGEIHDAIPASAELRYQTAAEVGAHAERRVLSVLTRIEEEEARRQAREVWRRLKERSAAERRELFEAFPEMSTWAVVEVLCAESCLAAAHSAVTAGELGELALSAAARLPAGQRSHAQGYAWAFVGNARRVGGKLSAANEAFALAAELWQAGDASEPLCPLDASRLLDLEASLRRDERRPSEALALLMRAAQFPNMSPHARARLLIQQANVFEIMGESAKAIAALREAEPAVEGCQDARLLWTLRCGLIVSLCSLGRAAEGAEQLTSARVLTARHGNALDVLRFRWLESRVAAGLGRTGEAIELLSSVRAAFADVEIVYDAALATSELAALYLQIGRTASVKALIRQSMPIFNAGGIYPEAQKALTTFAGAVERDAVTLALAQRLVTYIRRVQHHSGMLPFEV